MRTLNFIMLHWLNMLNMNLPWETTSIIHVKNMNYYSLHRIDGFVDNNESQDLCFIPFRTHQLYDSAYEEYMPSDVDQNVSMIIKNRIIRILPNIYVIRLDVNKYYDPEWYVVKNVKNHNSFSRLVAVNLLTHKNKQLSVYGIVIWFIIIKIHELKFDWMFMYFVCMFVHEVTEMKNLSDMHIFKLLTYGIKTLH